MDEHDDAYFMAVGKLINNTGAVETLLQTWLFTLSDDPVFASAMMNKLQLGGNAVADLVLDLVETKHPASLDAMKRLVHGYKKVAPTRNIVAHGPGLMRADDPSGELLALKISKNTIVSLDEIKQAGKAMIPVAVGLVEEYRRTFGRDPAMDRR